MTKPVGETKLQACLGPRLRGDDGGESGALRAASVDAAGKVVNETELIQNYLAPLAAEFPGAFGLTDDCGLIGADASHDLVVSTDPIIAGVHFFASDCAGDIAWKALAVNVSDLIAKGAAPLAYTMAIAFPQAPDRSWMAAFSEGLAAAQLAFGCHLIGGDTDRTPGPLSISITVFGQVPCGQMVRRSSARQGDHVFVTGTLGDSALGLEIHSHAGRWDSHLSTGEMSFLVGRYLRPEPRIAMVPLVRGYASAALDISDGLLKDLGRLVAPVPARIEFKFDKLPLSQPARRVLAADPQRAASVISGGDDYEVLFCVPPERLKDFKQALRAVSVQVSEIGVLEAGSGVIVRNDAGHVIDPGSAGYDHFSA